MFPVSPPSLAGAGDQSTPSRSHCRLSLSFHVLCPVFNEELSMKRSGLSSAREQGERESADLRKTCDRNASLLLCREYKKDLK